jgi:hypothetical protein
VSSLIFARGHPEQPHRACVEVGEDAVGVEE